MIFEKRTTKGDKVFDVIVILILFFMGAVALYPLFLVLIASVSDPSAVSRGEVVFWPKDFHTSAYDLILQDSRITIGYLNSIIYVVLGTVLSVIVTVMAAFSLSRKDMVGHAWITWFFLIPMYINGGLIPTFIQVNKLGLYNMRAAIVIIGCVSIWNVIICRSYFASTIPNELWEAASIDGCSMYRFFVSIVIPNSKAIVAIMVLYYAVAQWNDFFKSLIYLGESSKFSLQLVMREILLAANSTINASPELYDQLVKQAETLKYGIIVVSSLPVIALYPFIQKYFVKGVMVGSVKG